MQNIVDYVDGCSPSGTINAGTSRPSHLSNSYLSYEQIIALPRDDDERVERAAARRRKELQLQLEQVKLENTRAGRDNQGFGNSIGEGNRGPKLKA